MNLFPRLSLRLFFNDRTIATFLLVLFCILFVPIEQGGISLLKVGVMALCPLVFLLKAPLITKALLLGMTYWLLCYFLSLFKGQMRFSTLGFLGMHIMMFITYYSLIAKGAFTLKDFTQTLKWIILAFGIILVLQQCCLLVGIRNMPIINLQNQFYLGITKLPSLTLEPSHSARVLSALALGYWRCNELQMGRKLVVTDLFSADHKWVTILFFWAMLTMGSGTAFVGLGILSIYFVTPRTAVYIIPLLIGLFVVGNSMELTQMKRAMLVAKAAASGDAKEVMQTDGSAGVRVVSLLNTFTQLDLTKKEIWIGKASMEKDRNWWRRTDTKLTDQYGLIVFILSLTFVYSCMIRRFFSTETLLFVFLLGFSYGNIYYAWGCLMIMTGVRYFQMQQEKGLLEIYNNYNE